MMRLEWITCLVFLAACVACEQTPKKPTPPPASAASGPGAPSTGMRSPFAPKADGPILGPATDRHGVGMQAKARDYQMTVHGVAPCIVEQHFRPKAGMIKLGVDVEIESLAKRDVPANPLYAKLLDSQKETYAATLAGCTPMLVATRLAAGERARGTITFDVPENAQGLVMTYAPFIVGSGTQELEFALGR